MAGHSAHQDRFVLDRLPPAAAQPKFMFTLPELEYPQRLNVAEALLDGALARGWGERVVFQTPTARWTYASLTAEAGRIARVLRDTYKLIPGERVLLHGTNTPRMVACWFAILKAGGIVVATMPMLRARELSVIIEKAQARIALSESGLAHEVHGACKTAVCCSVVADFAPDAGEGELDRLAKTQDWQFPAVPTLATDPALLAFTSGTTGAPKATIHFHRDILAIADCFPRSVLGTQPDDIFLCTAPLAFTFGLGAHVIFPMRYGASSVLLPKTSPDAVRDALPLYKPTILLTAPTAYNAICRVAGSLDLPYLRHCVAAGEHLPLATFRAWETATGKQIIDGIGATEMLHIFVSNKPGAIRPGSTGQALPGYIADVLREDMTPAAPGEPGKLAVKGPTGCRYLDDARQATYVRDGWNLTGDTYTRDEDGFFWYQGRSDDMIVSSGYNISGAEVEEALLSHPAVKECAVVAAPDADRGMVVKAFICVAPGFAADDGLVKTLQDFTKATIAPYKYPRRIAFVDTLPRTQSGKIQRFVLRQQELEQGRSAG